VARSINESDEKSVGKPGIYSIFTLHECYETVTLEAVLISSASHVISLTITPEETSSCFQSESTRLCNHRDI
jgi:hypothetical protein